MEKRKSDVYLLGINIESNCEMLVKHTCNLSEIETRVFLTKFDNFLHENLLPKITN